MTTDQVTNYTRINMPLFIRILVTLEVREKRFSQGNIYTKVFGHINCSNCIFDIYLFQDIQEFFL